MLELSSLLDVAEYRSLKLHVESVIGFVRSEARAVGIRRWRFVLRREKPDKSTEHIEQMLGRPKQTVGWTWG